MNWLECLGERTWGCHRLKENHPFSTSMLSAQDEWVTEVSSFVEFLFCSSPLLPLLFPISPFSLFLFRLHTTIPSGSRSYLQGMFEALGGVRSLRFQMQAWVHTQAFFCSFLQLNIRCLNLQTQTIHSLNINVFLFLSKVCTHTQKVLYFLLLSQLTHLETNSFFSLSCIFIVFEDNQELWSCMMGVSILLLLNIMFCQLKFFCFSVSPELLLWSVFSLFCCNCLIMLILFCSFNLTVRLFCTKLIAAVWFCLYSFPCGEIILRSCSFLCKWYYLYSYLT